MFARRLTCALVLLAAVSACSKESPTEPDNSTIAYTAIGASDANGIGSSAPCLGSCTTGQGYVPQLTRRMQSSGRSVTLTNLGIPTAVLSPEFQQISNSVGRDSIGNFLSNEMPQVPSSTTLVTVFAGYWRPPLTVRLWVNAFFFLVNLQKWVHFAPRILALPADARQTSTTTG